MVCLPLPIIMVYLSGSVTSCMRLEATSPGMLSSGVMEWSFKTTLSDREAISKSRILGSSTDGTKEIAGWYACGETTGRDTRFGCPKPFDVEVWGVTGGGAE